MFNSNSHAAKATNRRNPIQFEFSVLKHLTHFEIANAFYLRIGIAVKEKRAEL